MKIKKILSFTLVLAMLAGMIPGMSLTASAAEETNAITSPAATGTMTINLHIHSFTAFELGTTKTTNDTIIATCTDKAHHPDGKDYTAKLTIAAPENLAYNGVAKEATVENEISGVTPDIVYEKDGASVTAEQVKEAGTYTASATLGSGGDAVTASVEFTITDSRFNVTVRSVIGGTVTPEPALAKFDDSVSLTLEPAAGYDNPPVITVKDDNGNDVPVQNNQFTMPASNVTVTAAFARVFNEVTFSPWLGEGLPDMAGNYYLTQDVALSSTWTVPAGTTSLFLNGHSISRAKDVPENTKFSLITVNSGATLNLYDEDGSTGAITGGRASSGGGVYVNQGTFNMYGGAISGNTATYSGGGVYIGGGTFNMYSGTITDNESTATDSSTRGGGGVYIYAGCTFAMSGGTISGNKALYGGGIFAHANAKLGAIVNLSGNPCVKDNLSGSTPNNVYLCSYMNNVASLTIADSLEESASIGVTMQKIGVFTSGLSGKGNASNFKSDSAAVYAVSTNESGEAQLVRYEHSFTYSVDGSVITAACGEDNCPLPEEKATLTLTAPTIAGGGASVAANPEGIFGTPLPTVKYQTKQEDDTWSTATSSKPTSAGEHRACVTLGDGENPVTAYAYYTIYPITISGNVNDAVSSAQNAAMEGEAVTIRVSQGKIPAGYSSASYTVKDGDGNELAVTDNKFTMPASDVTVTAAFTAVDYSVTVNTVEHGSVTTTATDAVHIGDKITLTVTPAENYGVKTVTTDSGTIVQTALDPETGVVTYELTMDAANATVTATFTELTTYTVFYNASNAPIAVSVKLAGGEQSYLMAHNAKLGSIDCWSTQLLAGSGVTSLPLSIKQSDETDWKALDIPVVTSLTAPEQGAAVAIEGETNAFVVAFVWGEEPAEGEEPEKVSEYYLVTSNTESINVPNPADTASENFTGWTYLVPASEQGAEGEAVTVNKAVSGDSTTVQLSKITQTTIVNAVWAPKQYTVSFDPDNGGGKTTQTVAHGSAGSAITLPDTPTKAGYEFVGWVLAKTAVEKVGNETSQFPAGTEFDFAHTTIINNLELKAKWRHVHSYVCLQLDNAVFDDAFKDFYGYKGQLHIKLCTSMDDYTAEAHSFVNGKCACGASVRDDKVSLTKYVGASKSRIDAIKNSFVSLSAPQKSGTQTFSKWQYSANTTNGQDGTWRDLTSMRNVAFAIPDNMSTRAVYENETAKLSIRSFKYDNSHVAFQFDYSVPDGYTVVDGGLMFGDNVRMKFWDCTIKSFLGSQYEPSLRDAVSVFGGGTIASKMYNYQTINEPGLATPILKPLKSFGRTGTVAVAWQPYTSAAYSKALNTNTTIKGYNQNKYPTYAMGYIICKHNGAYVGFMTNAISATLERPSASHVAQISVSG